MKTWEKYLAISLLGIMLLFPILLSTLFLSRNLILHRLIKKANKNLLITIHFDHSKVILLKTFPNIEIHFQNLSITGKYAFEKDTLLYVPDIKIIINAENFHKDSIFFIQEVSATHPTLNLIVTPEGLANYYLFPSKEELTASAKDFFIKIENLRIFRGKAEYTDYQSNIKISSSQIFGLFRNLVMSNNSATFYLSGIFNNFTVVYKKATLARDMTLSIDANYKNIFPACTDNYYFDGRFKINRLQFNARGIFENSRLCESKSYHNYSLKIDAQTKSFKDLLSVLNIFYRHNFYALQASGDYNISLNYYSRRDSSLDTNFLKTDIKIKNGYIRYPQLPESARDINLKASLEKSKDLKIKVDFANFRLGSGFFHLKNFSLSKDINNLYINGLLNYNFDLSQLQLIFPIKYKIQGKIRADIILNGKINLNNPTDISNINLTGSGDIKKFKFVKDDLTIESNRLFSYFSPDQILIQSYGTRINNFFFNTNAVIENLIPHIINPINNQLKINSAINFNKLDISPLRTSEQGKNKNSLPPIAIPKNSIVKSIITADTVIVDTIRITDAKTLVIFYKDTIKINSFSANYAQASFKAKGIITLTDKNAIINFASRGENINIQDIGIIFPQIEHYAPIVLLSRGLFSYQGGGTMIYNYQKGLLSKSIDITANIYSDALYLPQNQYTEKLARLLKIPSLAKPTIKHLNLYFRLSSGSLTIPETQFILSDRKASIKGFSSLTGLINYRLGIGLEDKELARIIHKNITGNTSPMIYISILGTINSPKIRLSTNLLQSSRKAFIQPSPRQQAITDSLAAMKVYKKELKKKEAIETKKLIKKTRKDTRQIMRKAKQIAQQLMQENTPEARKKARKVIRNARKMRRQLIKQANIIKKRKRKLYKMNLDSIKKKLRLSKKRIKKPKN